MKTKCAECGKEFIYMDTRNVPVVCGDKVCKTNYAYRMRHMDPVTGRIPTAEEVKKL